jgi:hypothetical protein
MVPRREQNLREVPPLQIITILGLYTSVRPACSSRRTIGPPLQLYRSPESKFERRMFFEGVSEPIEDALSVK